MSLPARRKTPSKQCPNISETQPPPQPTTSVQLLETLPTETVERNLDIVLETVRTLDNHCAFDKCKVKTNLIGHDCELCRERFCFKHGLPEIHGCGEAVRRDERRKFLKPVPLKTIRHQEDLSKAKVKLDAKLKDMSLSRKQKQPTGSGGAKRKGK